MIKMGCNVSSAIQRTKSLKETSGSVPILEENGNAKFDKRLPLTVRQKFNIMNSWKGIARNIEEAGILMFLRYVCFQQVSHQTDYQFEIV